MKYFMFDLFIVDFTETSKSILILCVCMCVCVCVGGVSSLSMLVHMYIFLCWVETKGKVFSMFTVTY